MKLKDYIKYKIFDLFLFFMMLILVFVLLILFRVSTLLIIAIPLIILIIYFIIIFHDFFKKKTFYDRLKESLKKLDKKYFITEVLEKPNFLEGEILLDSLYEIDKSYIEELNKYKYSYEEFKEYIEMWCHEIKTPVATTNLIINNNQNKTTESILEEIDKIDYYIEQVLFYARSEIVEKDYIISNTNLKEVINSVIKRNKKGILNKNIKIVISNISNVMSDSKWLEFILNQIITNSIKYAKEKNALIEITTITKKDNIVLKIKDNGIGIPINELDKVFEKGFTGSNGRKKYNSTGIGLYLVKRLCNKLGHRVEIDSKEGIETVVTITFPINSLTDSLR